jgi:hypothetical protein
MRQKGGPPFAKKEKNAKASHPTKLCVILTARRLLFFLTFLTSLPTYIAILFDGFVNGKYIGSVEVLLGF